MLAIAAAAALVSFRSVYEPDLGWHLAQGRENLAGRLVRTNVFSFTYPEYRQHYTSWLADTSAYAAWRIGGDAGIQALQAVAVAAALALTYFACRVQSAAAAVAGDSRARILRARTARDSPSPSGVVCRDRRLLLADSSARSPPAPPGHCGGRCRRSRCGAICTSNAYSAWRSSASSRLAECVRPSALTRPEAVRGLTIAAAATAAMLANPYGWGLFHYLFENATVPQILSIAELRPAYLPTYRAFFAYVAVAALADVVAAAPARAGGKSSRSSSSPRSAIAFFASRRSSFSPRPRCSPRG